MVAVAAVAGFSEAVTVTAGVRWFGGSHVGAMAGQGRGRQRLVHGGAVALARKHVDEDEQKARRQQTAEGEQATEHIGPGYTPAIAKVRNNFAAIELPFYRIGRAIVQ